MGSRFLRLCCAILLMGIALSAGAVGVLSLEKTQGANSDTPICLHESTGKGGYVELCKAARGSFRQIIYTLRSDSFEISETVQDASAGQCLSLIFDELPYGDYTLVEDGHFCCRVTLSEEQPCAILSLP